MNMLNKIHKMFINKINVDLVLKSNIIILIAYNLSLKNEKKLNLSKFLNKNI